MAQTKTKSAPRRLTPQQTMRIERNLRTFGCDPEDKHVEFGCFDLPEGWVFVTIGLAKGRPFSFGVSPSGDAHS